jgi:hypothetical protein
MGVAEKTAGQPSSAGLLDQDAAASIAALSAAAHRLADFAVEAAELDESAVAIRRRERELEKLSKALAGQQARQAAHEAELAERERAVSRERDAVIERASIVARREKVAAQLHAQLVEQARALEKRAARFHWRWFVRAWSWRPPRLGSKPRTCELFFVPSPGGYKLLEQTGVALTPEAQLTGLLDERTTYVVTRIAQRPFDGRWCAYLEISDFRGGTSDD